jgi:hypothetical protein
MSLIDHDGFREFVGSMQRNVVHLLMEPFMLDLPLPLLKIEMPDAQAWLEHFHKGMLDCCTPYM